MGKIDLCSLEINELEKVMADMGEKKFRASQIFYWVNKKNAKSFDEMTNLSLEMRRILNDKFYFDQIKIIEKINCSDGTIKFLLQLSDYNIIESVLMKHSYGNTVCVSSQVGCKMKCKFCASTINGLKRNLSAGEIARQVYFANEVAHISNIVIMGSGEPLDNYENVTKFIKIINSPLGINIGQRHITLSTCGITDKIYLLASENLQITLAVSIHAPNNSLRKKIMPVANKYSINDIINACRFYFETTGRRITFEYILIKSVNDSEENALELGKLVKKFPSHVNLIPVNEINESGFKKSSIDTQNKFEKILKSFGVEVTVRKKLGNDDNAACGQLKNFYVKSRVGD